jgi:hypothetical protein
VVHLFLSENREKYQHCTSHGNSADKGENNAPPKQNIQGGGRYNGTR